MKPSWSLTSCFSFMMHERELKALRLTCQKLVETKPFYDVYYGTKWATTSEQLILWHQLHDIKNCKLRALSNEYCLDFIEQSIDEINHFSSLKYYPRHSKWRVIRSAGRNFWAIAKIFIWTSFWCWIQIMHSFYCSTTNKKATAWFHVDSAIVNYK